MEQQTLGKRSCQRRMIMAASLERKKVDTTMVAGMGRYELGGRIRLGCVGRTADRGQEEPEKSATKDDPRGGCAMGDRLRERALARLPLPLPRSSRFSRFRSGIQPPLASAVRLNRVGCTRDASRSRERKKEKTACAPIRNQYSF